MAIFASLVGAIHLGTIRIPNWLGRSWVWGIFQQLDSGVLRVVISTYQIVGSVAWNLDIAFPFPFGHFVHAMSFVSLNLLGLDCYTQSYYTTALARAIIPVLLLIFNGSAYCIRQHGSTTTTTSNLIKQHAYVGLIITYVLVPPASRSILQSMDCITVANNRYLRIDTNVDCDSRLYHEFASVNAVFAVAYLSVPLTWIVLLWTKRREMNPYADPDLSYYARNSDPNLASLKFLFAPYRAGRAGVFAESLDIIRRIILIGCVPLVSARPIRRAAFGLFLSFCSLLLCRETEPFERSATNVLNHAAQCSILITYGGALAIDSEISKNIDPLLLGINLCVVNLCVIVLALMLGIHSHLNSGQWNNGILTTGEFAVVIAGMGCSATASSIEQGGVELIGERNSEDALRQQHNAKLLQQHLINAKDVQLSKRIGAGGYGEVFQGTCLGVHVAIKTMHKVNFFTVSVFRAEILLTSTLRHPNIIGFVGACWSRELTCLILEWAPRGSLADLLKDRTLTLEWSDPLIKLARDVSRGMTYLHQREFFEEITGKLQRCIIHRDLKPENVLITEFTSAKLADFGTSRAKEEEVTMTALGTPLYAAPELMRGEMFDEKVDVYSFGLLLIDLGLREDNLAVFLGEQWAKDYGARAPECNSISFRRLVLGAIWDEGWRPLSNEPGRSLAGAPAVIHTLVVRCCSHKPSERPSFEEILETLSEALVEEIGDADRYRHNTKIGYSRSDITNPLSGVEEPLPSVIARTVGASNEKQRQEQRTEHHLRMSGLFKTRNSNSTRGLAAIRRSSSLAGPKYENPGVFAEQTEV